MRDFTIAIGRQLATGLACTLALISTSSVCLAGDAAPANQESKAAAGAPSSASEEALATARLHFQNGVDLIQSTPPNYQDAYRQFQLASEKSGGSWKVMGNLGLCALKLERDGEALAYYGEYLEKGGDDVDPQERKEIERELLLLRGNLATLKLQSSEPSARIRITRQGSQAPTQIYSLTEGASEVGIRAGSLVVEAQSGDKTLEWKPVLSPGEEATHLFDFSAKPEAESAPMAAVTEGSAPEERPRSMSGLRLAGIVTAGVGVVGLGGGAVFGIMSQGAKTKAEETCVEGICEESTQDDFNAASSQAMVANIMFIGGGVLAATGITLIVIGGNKPSEGAPSAARLMVTPLASSDGGGLFASGRF